MTEHVTKYMKPEGLVAVEMVAAKQAEISQLSEIPNSICILVSVHSSQKIALLKQTLSEIIQQVQTANLTHCVILVGVNQGKGLRGSWLDEGADANNWSQLGIRSLLHVPLPCGELAGFPKLPENAYQPGVHCVIFPQSDRPENAGKIRMFSDLFSVLNISAAHTQTAFSWMLALDAETRLRPGTIEHGVSQSLDPSALTQLLHAAELKQAVLSPRVYNTPYSNGEPSWTRDVSATVEAVSLLYGLPKTQAYTIATAILKHLTGNQEYTAPEPYSTLTGGCIVGKFSTLLALGEAYRAFPDVANEDYLISCIAQAADIPIGVVRNICVANESQFEPRTTLSQLKNCVRTAFFPTSLPDQYKRWHQSNLQIEETLFTDPSAVHVFDDRAVLGGINLLAYYIEQRLFSQLASPILYLRAIEVLLRMQQLRSAHAHGSRQSSSWE